MASSLPFSILLSISIFTLFTFSEAANNVTYDRRSLIIDGQRKLIISAAIHYPRSVPAMWPELVQAAKEGGIDAIETYVFWNGHEPSQSQYYFEGRFNLVKFIKIVQQAEMYLILRIGPFIAAEWNYGGVPVWLHYITGTIFRTDNAHFKDHMKNFTTLIVDLMKKENLFASQGGPIIMAQIENEYFDTSRFYGHAGKRYSLWAAQMAVSQNISVPWIMCQQNDAPDPVINTCNSFYCDSFIPNSPNKPKMWTENWTGWFQYFGGRYPHRPSEDIAFAVARFFQKGGSLQNYYMYHGGTNFGRTAGGPFITTSYDYEAPIDEYGLRRQPKWGHLRKLHRAIKSFETTILNSNSTTQNLGPLLEADIYTVPSGACVAFLANIDDKSHHTIIFRNNSYQLPAWSVSILENCTTVIFNTATIGSQASIVQMVSDSMHSLEEGLNTYKWDFFVENVGFWGEAGFLKTFLDDHINITKDTTDYLWYTTRLEVDETEAFLKNGSQPFILVESKGHALHAFVNNKLLVSGSGNGTAFSFKIRHPISLRAGKNEIALLSMTVGQQNAGPFYEWNGAGPTSVKISGFNSGIKDLSRHSWAYKIGLQGEYHKIYKEGVNKVSWQHSASVPLYQPLTWYKAFVNSPPGDEPVGLDMLHMGKGMAWLNGEEIGRYWLRNISIHDDCVSECNYRGVFSPNKCSDGCGKPSQRWYHVPRSWFMPTGNMLVIFEEIGGDPTKISFSRRKTSSICVSISEDHPSLDIQSWHEKGKNPTATLECPKNTRVSSIKFASFGNPTGMCGSYTKGDCHNPNSASIVEKACLNKAACEIELSEENLGKDLCSGITRKLALQAACA